MLTNKDFYILSTRVSL